MELNSVCLREKAEKLIYEQERLFNFFLNHHIISSKPRIIIHNTCLNIEEAT